MRYAVCGKCEKTYKLKPAKRLHISDQCSFCCAFDVIEYVDVEFPFEVRNGRKAFYDPFHWLDDMDGLMLEKWLASNIMGWDYDEEPGEHSYYISEKNIIYFDDVWSPLLNATDAFGVLEIVMDQGGRFRMKSENFSNMILWRAEVSNSRLIAEVLVHTPESAICFASAIFRDVGGL